MAIPNFDHNKVLPPHIGDPRRMQDLSPYPCSTLDLCQKFATSIERIRILEGFLSFRQQMFAFNISNGFQWLDGSFMEDVEHLENRAPNDIDIVTFYMGMPRFQYSVIQAKFPEFISRDLSKSKYLVDHFGVDCSYRPDFIVEATRYWIQLFTHNRHRVWKGMLRLELNTPDDDQAALNYLKAVSL